MIKSEEEEVEELSNEPSNLNQLMSVVQPFSSRQYARDIVQGVKDGNVNPLAAMVVVKRCAKVAEIALKDEQFKAIAADEAYKHLSGNQKTFEIYSSTISRGATSTKYDFSECGDIVLEELYKIQEYVKAEVKKREEKLKLLIVNETGKIGEFGIDADSEDIVIKQMPKFMWEAHDDQITVKAPRKMQTLGIKFMKV